MPAGEIGAGDVTYLAAAYQGVQGIERLLYRGERVEAVQMVDVDVVRSQAAETRLAGMHEMQAAGADLVRTVTHGEGGFGRYEHLIATAGDRLTENLLRSPSRVNIGRVEEVYSRFQTDVDQARSLGNISRPPRSEKLALTAKGRCTKTKHRHLQTRMSKSSEFHSARINDGIFPNRTLVV